MGEMSPSVLLPPSKTFLIVPHNQGFDIGPKRKNAKRTKGPLQIPRGRYRQGPPGKFHAAGLKQKWPHNRGSPGSVFLGSQLYRPGR